MFTTKTKTRDHAYQYHEATGEDGNITGDDADALISMFTQYMLGVDTCPLCQETGPIDSPELVDHVMEHIHEFSLRSLPWPRPNGIDYGGEVGSYNPTCDVASCVNKWLDGLEPQQDLIHGNGLSHQLSEFDHDRLAMVGDQNATAQNEDNLVEVCFADEHGGESAVAETDISPLTQRTLPSLSDSSGVLPDQVQAVEEGMLREDPGKNIEGLQRWLRKTDKEIERYGAPLSSQSRGAGSSEAGILRRSRDWMLRTFWAREVEVTMVGLEGCGKTSLLRLLAGGEFTLDSLPTVGFNMKKIQRNNVTIKCWDIGGQPRFRSMWERYCRGVGCIIFVVDASDAELIPLAKEELHNLISQESTQGIPLLVLGNNSDRPRKLTVDELIERLDLKSLQNRQVSCYGISAKEETNLDAVVEFIAQFANR
ncbi:arf/Sar family, other [Fusarium austroafricanum]|uniref:Arf/Sar family, other n=1 Tax=Fusarium austroafricanum TaxID=2364996 RepID=A0A8H4KNE5_9HYPO|nr:arf/Sar family, other [Fusarium austroafricanum]